MIKEKIDGFGEFEFYKNYFVGRIYEGVNAVPDFSDALSELIQKHFSGRPVIYISDRVNSYSVDPLATKELIVRNNIQFTGAVVYTPRQKRISSFEDRIIEETKRCSFDSLDVAVSWAELKAQELN